MLLQAPAGDESDADEAASLAPLRLTRASMHCTLSIVSLGSVLAMNAVHAHSRPCRRSLLETTQTQMRWPGLHHLASPAPAWKQAAAGDELDADEVASLAPHASHAPAWTPWRPAHNSIWHQDHIAQMM